MAVRREKIQIVLDADGFTQALNRIRNAAEANPMRDDETPVEWMRRVIDAAYWHPEGWDRP